MKIYFEDGQLNIFALELPNVAHYIDASCGYSANQRLLDKFKKNEEMHNTSISIYTNSLIALSNKYCWNSELKLPELYLREYKDGPFVRVTELTDKEIHQVHNLMQMYINGAFHSTNESFWGY